MNGALPEPDLDDGDIAKHHILSMSASKTVSYAVEHTELPIFDPTNTSLSAAVAGMPVLLVVDESLWQSYGAKIEYYARTNMNCVGLVRLVGSEITKSLEQVAGLCGTAFDACLPRHGAFIAIGGGAILDAVGFAASIYRRGVAYVRVPTTLIGMIDVGVGIKQAINFRNKKNALGSFYPPRRTINDVRFLRSLPRRELACGLAEALKMGLVADRVLFELIEAHAVTLLKSGFQSPAGVAESVLLRAEVSMMQQLSANLYESETRRLVDFGHSFSPIIETTSDYAVAHGEAVGLDILLSTAIAVGRAMCDADLTLRLIRLYGEIGLPVIHPLMSPLQMERALVDARAHRRGELNLVVPTGVGSAEFLQDVTYNEIAVALASIQASVQGLRLPLRAERRG